MKTVTSPALSSLVREQINRPSPIRQIMKMAERQNILAMGLDPAQVISFGGGWVNHSAPDEFRQAYESVVSDAELFHKSGGYTATLGDMECREQIARFEEELFGMPRLGAQHIAIGMGSTQLTHDLFRTLLDPGDTVMLLDPTYANYEGQLAFSVPGVKIVRLRVLDPQTWSYLPETDPAGIAREFSRLFDLHRPRMVLFGAPDNPTSQVVPQALADVMLAKTSEAGAWLVIDAAYKCQYFQTPPAYYAWSPADHPNVVGIHSNSKWARGLGRRLGWIEAQESGRRGDRARAAVQHPVPRHAVADGDGEVSEERDPERIAEALRGGCQRALQERRGRDAEGGRYAPAAAAPHAVRRPLHRASTSAPMPRSSCPKALKATGVLVVPGGGFGESLTNGVRISFGPLVKDTREDRRRASPRLRQRGCAL